MAFFPQHNHYRHNKSSYEILPTIKLVVVMSAVELWKAQQPLLSQRPSVTFSKWRIVGNGENAALDRGPERRIKISSVTLNRISASSPTPMHSLSHANFAERSAAEELCRHQDREIP
jgi:hypothetical protein